MAESECSDSAFLFSMTTSNPDLPSDETVPVAAPEAEAATAPAPVAAAPAPAPIPQTDNRRRLLRDLLSIPERDRTDEQWDEIIELEIQLAPGNRLAPGEQQQYAPRHHGKPSGGGNPGGQQKKHRPRQGGSGNNRRPRQGGNKPNNSGGNAAG